MKKWKNEAEYQAYLIDKIDCMFNRRAMVLKNDSSYRQGIPDLVVFYEGKWAWLEVKIAEKAPHRPNQNWYIEWADERAFGKFIYPENEDRILEQLFDYFVIHGRINND